MQSFPIEGAFEYRLPTESGFHCGNAVSVSGSAASTDLNGTWGSVTNRVAKGGAWITIQARGADVYVRNTDTATTATTAGNASNGMKIPDGSKEHVYICAERPYLDLIGSGSGTAYLWFSSRNFAAPQ